LQIAHRFETFLMTLYREVQKRSILQSQPGVGEVASPASEGPRSA
jgi:hypothetical protein